MDMELQQAKADATKLQAELKSKDDALQSNEALVAALQAVIQSKDELLRSKLLCAKYVRQVSIPPTLLPSSLRALMPAAQLTSARDAKTWVYEVCVRVSDNAYHCTTDAPETKATSRNKDGHETTRAVVPVGTSHFVVMHLF